MKSEKMKKEIRKKIRRFNIATHRDLGYFFSSLIIVYCLSGIALNHINDWNPDFIITKENVSIDMKYSIDELNNEIINNFGKLVGEEKFKVFDSPTKDQVKVYYDNASFHINFTTGTGVYEKISRRPVFYESNLLHRNSITGWKWVSDIFGLFLIIINITGLFILKGKKGLIGRGKWFITAGALPPVVALIIFEII